MSDLVAWLTKILDEDADAAEGNGTIAWLTFRKPDGQMEYTAVACGEPDDYWVVDGKERTDYASVQVVLDERQVLADIAAKRAIIDQHSYHLVASYDSHIKPIPGTETPRCNTCGSQDENGEDWPCETVRLLVSAYTDRPGYSESWKP